MSDAPPAPTSVASRFVSSKDLEAASLKRKEEWAAAYARIGQEPPKEEEGEGTYDPRSLWEKLQENKSKKQEAFEEQLKFKNHFRALDEEEISFLDSMIDENNDEEQERQRMIKEEMQSFRKAVTARSVPIPPPSILASTSSSSSLPIASTSSSSSSLPKQSPPLPTTTSTSTTTTTGKMKGKGKKLKGLPGLVVKKPTKKTTSKPTPSPTPPITTTVEPSSIGSVEGEVKESEEGENGSKKRSVQEDEGGNVEVESGKKRKVDDSEP
ncbi:hypothetical protein JCM16303_006494 [Sporobolomyces ruberrimus]